MEDEKQKPVSIFSQMEEDVLAFWQKNEIFKKSVEKEAPQGNYIFYDGPPFITGLPHYGSLLPSIAKDIIPRYQTMKGYRVNRGWGWDCHGLPAENRVEKNLGLKNKKDIEKLGVGKFIDACRDYVQTGSEQWKWYIDRIGRWVDMGNPYRTMDLDFMESVIWAFKELYDKGLIYEGYRTSLHCTRCATPLSKFEITMDAGSYKDVENETVTVEFEAENGLRFLAWTTTPWTLPGNLSLAIGQETIYAVIESSGKKYVLAKERIQDFFKGKEFNIVKETKGKEFIGLRYTPIFDLKNEKIEKNENAFKVYAADFVSTEEGTGIVHIAPNFGEDDFELGRKVGLPIVELMDENGIYTDEAGDWNGQHFKKVNEMVPKQLGDKIFLKEKHTHSYPFCYRCESELIYRSQKAWYLKITEIREKLLESNKEINWVPSYFKEGRFKYNLESAPDWCLSRSRYWGSPVPVWKCESCSEIKVVGSIKEIEESSGKKISDLHRPDIDEVEFNCSCNGKMKRVLDVLDCWFESGAMPFAQFHYPYDKKEEWPNLFPADFIIEYTGQLRGWFYYLHVLANTLFNSKAFRNVIVTGVLAGTDGRKMSKSFGNYPDPKIVLNEYGSDALRIYFMSGSVMLGGDMVLAEEDIRDALRKNVILFWNVAQFYDLFAKNSGFSAEENPDEPVSNNVLDKWILSELNKTIKEITRRLDEYNLPSSCQPITLFIGDLSTWYVRRSRNRFKNNDEKDRRKALETLSYVLIQFSKTIAPIMPFIAEQVWQKTTGHNFENADKSVHLENWVDSGRVDEEVLKKMSETRKIVESGLALRDEKKIKVRQPLQELIITNYNLEKEYDDLLKEELNVKNIRGEKKDGETKVDFNFNITEELKLEGMKREMVRLINGIRKRKNLSIGDIIKIRYQTESVDIKKIIADEEMKKSLLQDTIAEEIIEGVVGEKETADVNGEKAIFEIDYV